MNEDLDLDDTTINTISDDSSSDRSEEEEVNKAWSQGQVLSVPAGEDWESPESDGTSLSEIATDIGATREAVVSGMWHIAQHGTKEISDGDGWSITVNNDSLKFEALKALSKIYTDEKKNKKQKVTGLKYILIRDGN